MTKTIEEAAREFMETAPIEAVSPYYEDDMIEMFRGGTAHLLSLPLSQRLTDEERERVRKMYKEELEFAQFYWQKAYSCSNRRSKTDYEMAHDMAKSRAGLLESIFGKELFGEGEE